MTRHEIDSVETIIVDLPLARLQRFAVKDSRTQSIVLIRTTNKDGITGIGEAVTPAGPWWGGESVETIKFMIDSYLTPTMLNQDPFLLNAILNRMDKVVFGNSFAKAGLEMALLDLQGRISECPLHVLLGGKIRDSLPCAWPLATGEVADEVAEAERMLEKGWHNRFKLKMGALDPEADIARASEIARALAGRCKVRVDPNESWDEVTAKKAIYQLSDVGIEIVEQPLPRESLSGMSRLTSQSSCAIMVDEGVRTLDQMLLCGQIHAADLVSIKIMKHGGILAAQKVANIATASGISLYMGTFLESSIGTAANMQFASTLESLPFGGELCGPNLIADDLAQQPMVYRDNALQLPEGHGIGVDIDEDKLAHYRRDRSTIMHSISA